MATVQALRAAGRRLNSKAASAVSMLRKGGISEVLDHLTRDRKRRIEEEYSFLAADDSTVPPAAGEVTENSVNWLISAYTAASGGIINAVRFISMLGERGYDCRIIVNEGAWFGTASEVRASMVRSFGPFNASVYIGIDSAPPAFAAVATGWPTAHAVRSRMRARKKFYFVQDFEPWFYPVGSQYLFAESTYRFGFVGLTAGGWLAQKLRSEYDMRCHPVGFSYDKALYSPGEPVSRSTKRIFFYARPTTERRAFELGVLALRQVCLEFANVEVVLAGSDLSRVAIPFRHVSVGLISVEQLPALYRSCDVALVLSITNLSLLPLELMACGVPVVSNSGPWTQWLLSSDNCVLASPETGALSAAVVALLRDDVGRARMREVGLAFAASTSWEREGDAMAAALAANGCVTSAVGRGEPSEQVG